VAGIDYIARTTVFTFNNGTSSALFVVPILNTTSPSAPKTFLVQLVSPVGLKLGSFSSATVTIINNNARLISSSDPRESEGGNTRNFYLGNTVNNLTFVISLSGPALANATLSYTTVDGTAKAGIDYIFTNGTYTFPVNATSLSVNVPIIANYLAENPKTVYLNITSLSVSLATDANTNGVGTILNDDFNTYAISGHAEGPFIVRNYDVNV